MTRLTGALRVTDVAVSVPVASLLPVAVMHIPGVMSARVPVLVCVIVVVGAYVTVESPVLLLRISVDPLIWTSWPKAAFRANPPRPPADGDADGRRAAAGCGTPAGDDAERGRCRRWRREGHGS